jgi:hypothetical protein
MCFGFEVSDGWYNIIDMMCSNIQHHIDWKNRDGIVVKQVVAVQVKEKFGSLRFYYEGGDETIDGIVTMAESMSGVTCEQCGSPGVQRGSSWIKTLCDKHHEERNQK